MWSPTISSDELYHHGILNMKWGVRNGPPYPLKPGAHSAAEKKAMGKKTKKETDPGKAATKRKFSLSEDQKKTLKKVAIGTAVVGSVALAAYAGYKLNTPEFQTMVKAARANKSVDDYIKTMSDKELKKLVGPTAGQKLKRSLADIAGKDVKDQVKSMNYSKTQDKAFNEMMNRINTIDDLDLKKASSAGKDIGRLTGYQQLSANAEKGKKAGNLAAKKVAEAAKEATKKVSDTAPKTTETVKKVSDTVSKAANNVTKISTNANRAAQNVKKTATTTAKAATETAKKVSNTATQAVKKTVSSGPKLEFGGPSSSSGSSDLDRLLKAASTLSSMSNEAKKQSNKSTGQKDYTDSLLNKNGGKLKNMSMDDLKKLDLY